MDKRQKQNCSLMFRLIPTIIILIFVMLYIVATMLYPGGSDVDLHAKGFSWLHNYWCNLTASIAKNGQANPAQSVALTAQFILCIGLLFFWYRLPVLFDQKKIYSAIRWLGCSAMLMAVLVFTPLHEWSINIGGMLGVAALSTTFFGLYQHQYRSLFYVGLFSLTWVLLDYFVYKTNVGEVYSPLIQKFTFLFFFVWIMMMDFKMKKMN
jgi:hypothetical protein